MLPYGTNDSVTLEICLCLHLQYSKIRRRIHLKDAHLWRRSMTNDLISLGHWRRLLTVVPLRNQLLPSLLVMRIDSHFHSVSHWFFFFHRYSLCNWSIRSCWEFLQRNCIQKKLIGCRSIGAVSACVTPFPFFPSQICRNQFMPWMVQLFFSPDNDNQLSNDSVLQLGLSICVKKLRQS